MVSVEFYKSSDNRVPLSFFNIDNKRACRQAHLTHFLFTYELNLWSDDLFFDTVLVSKHPFLCSEW